MKKTLIVALLAFSGLACLPARAQNIAIVNGKAVPSSRLEALSQQMAKAGRPVTAEMQVPLREEVITREIFMQEAQKLGLDVTDDFRIQMELVRQQVLIRELITDFQKKNPVTDADAQVEYDKFAATNGGKEYKASHILVEKEADAKAIIASLKKGGKFDLIAKKSSKDPGSGANGGALDWAAAGGYVKEFSEAMVALEKGKMTELPVKTQFGYHIIRLDDLRDAALPKFEEVKPQILQQLQQQKLAQFQQDLRSKAKVE